MELLLVRAVSADGRHENAGTKLVEHRFPRRRACHAHVAPRDGLREVADGFDPPLARKLASEGGGAARLDVVDEWLPQRQHPGERAKLHASLVPAAADGRDL